MDDELRPSPTILLLRHTEVEGGDRVLWGRSPGVQLSSAGRAAAYSLARGLVTRGIAQVVSSPQPCALETAAILAHVLKAVLRVDPRLNEFDFGDWTGRGFTELQRDPAWRHFNQTRACMAAPNGETIANLQDRVHRAIQSLSEEAMPVAAVTHETVIRAALLQWMLWRPAEWAAIDVPPASVAELRRIEGGWSVIQPRVWHKDPDRGG